MGGLGCAARTGFADALFVVEVTLHAGMRHELKPIVIDRELRLPASHIVDVDWVCFETEVLACDSRGRIVHVLIGCVIIKGTEVIETGLDVARCLGYGDEEQLVGVNTIRCADSFRVRDHIQLNWQSSRR